MAKIARVLLLPFGDGGPTNDFAQFGSQVAAVPLKTKDPSLIQALDAWNKGLKQAVVVGNRAPFLEDINGVLYVTSRHEAYFYQEGVPEWESNTTYYANSIVKKPGTLELYGSKIDSNTGNALPSQTDDTNWKFIGPSTGLTGEIKDFGGVSVPTGYLLCDGSAVSRTTYANLFAAIGTNWGVGDGVTTFNLPDFRRRTAVGSGGSGSAQLGNAVGNVGGEENHTLTISEMPAHHHTEEEVVAGVGLSGGGSFQNGTTNTGDTGGGASHNTMQPSAVVLKIIKT